MPDKSEALEKSGKDKPASKTEIASKEAGDNLRGEWLSSSSSIAKSNTSETKVRGQEVSGLAGKDKAGDSLLLTDPFKSAVQAAGDQQPVAPHGWTMVIDLTTDLSEKWGAHHQFEKLKELVEQSKGKDVTMIVQIPRDATEGDTNAARIIDMYKIRDGKLEKIETEPSQGTAKDLEHLLKKAAELAPSAKIGLIIQGHGAANGIGASTGTETMTSIREAVERGLAGSTHKQLDLLDLDCCEMASIDSLSEASKFAKQIVASEDPEAAGQKYDAQNLKKVMEHLLARPEMSESELAADFVHAADRGQNGKPEARETGDIPHIGTDTLAHFDSEKFGQFKDALKDLGSVLSRAADDPESRKEIQKIIDGGQTLPLDPKEGDGDRTDISQFCRALIKATKDGTISDLDHQIETAAEKLLAAQKAMTSEFHGESAGGYDKLGGLSTYLPKTNDNDDYSIAEKGSVLFFLKDQTSAKMLDGASEDKQGAVAAFAKLVETCTEVFGKEAFAPVIAAMDRLKIAQSPSEFEKAFAELHEASEKMLKSPREAEIITGLLEKFRDMRIKKLASKEIVGADEWNRFIHKMARLPYEPGRKAA